MIKPSRQHNSIWLLILPVIVLAIPGCGYTPRDQYLAIRSIIHLPEKTSTLAFESDLPTAPTHPPTMLSSADSSDTANH